MKMMGGNKTPPKDELHKAKLAYVNQLYKQLQEQSAICNEKLPKRILDKYAEISMSVSYNASFNRMVDKSVNVTSKEIVEQMIKGQVYKDGMGLDSRLWHSVNASGQKIEDAITSCLARGIGSAEASKTIAQFAKTGHHTWDKKKIREKLGSKYAEKYGTGGLDYEALRLMRTTTTHMAQLSAINSHKVNPYSNAVIYHIGHAGSRTCAMCKERNGKKFKLEDVPLDHPNGLCWLEPFMSVDGKNPASLADLMDDMNNYYDGKPNSGLMDKWLKENGETPVKSKPQQPKIPTLPKGHLYTPKQREQKYKELETHLSTQVMEVLNQEFPARHSRRQQERRAKELEEYRVKTVTGVMSKLKKYPEPIQDLYLYSSPQLKMGYTPKGAYYHNYFKSVFFSIEDINRDRRGEFATVFHEWGHLIDNQLISGTVLTTDKKEEMYKMLKQDLENQIQYHINNSNVDRKAARKLIKSELCNSTDKIAGTSDIYGGLTGNQVKGYWGHAKSYWTRDDKKAEVCSEAWANILQGYGDDEQSKYLNKYLPGGKAFVEKTVEELIEKVKKGEI